MLMRTDPFRELDRITQQVFGANGTLARPAVMPMDAWRDGDTFHVQFDLPGINPDSIDLDVERNVVTVKAERPPRTSDAELIAAERPRGVFSRQLILGDNLDTEHIGPDELAFHHPRPDHHNAGQVLEEEQEGQERGYVRGVGEYR